MKRIRITDYCSPHFAKAWELYKASFPLHSQRLLEDQQAALEDEGYHFEVLEQAGRFIGILLYWENARFIYIEHLAIDPALQGGGMGTKVMDLLMQVGKKIILAIDQVVDQVSANHLNFYTRMGFMQNAFQHIRIGVRVRLVKHSLVSLAGGSRLVRINSGKNYNLILNLFFHSAKTA